jgi:preprotein translocase subunit SecD
VASSTPVKKARRSLAWLGVLIIALVGVNLYGTLVNHWEWTPKLALDLKGGTQLILAPQLEKGQEVTPEQLAQAVAIIRQRVDAGGVAEPDIRTQGEKNIVVSVAGEPDAATLARIQSSAKLEFRPVLLTAAAATSAVGDDGTNPTSSPTATPSLETEPSVAPTNASDDAWITPALQYEYDHFDCASLATNNANVAPAGEPLVTCDDEGQYKYLLGPVEVAGETIAKAKAQTQSNSQGASTGVWEVAIEFNDKGTKEFAAVTQRLFAYGTSDVHNRFAIVLDGRIITAPTTNAVIENGKPAISGAFNQESAKTLADQLRFGALPVGFELQSRDTISATLGTSQLSSGLIAGLIGLILVVIYSLFQYRLLGTVTIVSLVVAAVLTYLFINIFAWRNGYRLSLAGIAGLIVAIGFTADSFIVYFERIRDELRDGRSLVSSVEAGWKRALRTVFAAKSVNLLSAVVLYLLTVGSVQGFAFTLGVTTIIDVIVVVLFTHPVLQLLAATRFFSSGHPITGLDPNALGAVYRGRAQFRTPVLTAARNTGATKEAARRQTIAERKAAESAPAKPDTKRKGKDS